MSPVRGVTDSLQVDYVAQQDLFPLPIEDEIQLHLRNNYASLMCRFTKRHDFKFFSKLRGIYGYKIPLLAAERLSVDNPEYRDFYSYIMATCWAIKKEEDEHERS